MKRPLEMKRPLLIGAIFFISGIIAGQYLDKTDIALFFAAVTAASAGISFFHKWKPGLVFILFAAMGFACYGARTGIDPELASFGGAQVTVEGVVEEATPVNRGWKLVVRTATVKGGNKTVYARVRLRVMLFQDIEPNRYIQFTTELEPLERAKNPGEFDEFLYLRARGVHFSGVVGKIIAESKMEPPLLDKIRSRISAVYDSVLPEREAAVIKSMIIGDSAALDDQIKELYRVAGIYHILSISGLHITVLAAFLDAILGRILKPRTGAIVIISFLAVYSVLTGANPATVRAAVMYSVILVGKVLGREGDIMTSLAVTAMGLLMYQPLYLWDVGFQYSFAAVMGIVLFNEPLLNILYPLRLPKIFSDTFAVSAAATLATIPIAAYYFYNVALYSIPVNVIIVPSSAIALVMGFIVGIVGMAAEPLAVFLSGSIFVLLKLYEGICEFFAALSGANLFTGSWPLPVMAGWYIFWIAFAFCFYPKDGKKRAKRSRYFIGLWSGLLVAAAVYMFMPGQLRLHSLNLGGEASGTVEILQSGSQTFIIDDGPEENGYTIKNFLDFHGIKNVTAYFVINKPVSNANKTIFTIIDKRPEIIFTGTDAKELDFYTQRYGIPVEAIFAGQTFKRGNLEFKVTGEARLEIEINEGG